MIENMPKRGQIVCYRLSNQDLRVLEERGQARNALVRPGGECPMVVAEVQATPYFFDTLSPWRIDGAVLLVGAEWLWVNNVAHRRVPGGWDWVAESAETPDTQEEDPRVVGPHPVPTAIVCSTCGLPWDDHGESPTQTTCIALLRAKSKPFAYLDPISRKPSTFDDLKEKVEIR